MAQVGAPPKWGEEVDDRRVVEGLLHGHDPCMGEYAWPMGAEVPVELFHRRWAATVAALPLGASITGEVFGRPPFGVFLRVAGVQDAMALAEHQVRVRLLEWAAPAG